MKVYESPYIEPAYIADEIKPVMPHALIVWLIKLLGGVATPVCYVRGAPIKEQRAYIMKDKIFMSPLMYQAFRKDDSIINMGIC